MNEYSINEITSEETNKLKKYLASETEYNKILHMMEESWKDGLITSITTSKSNIYFVKEVNDCQYVCVLPSSNLSLNEDYILLNSTNLGNNASISSISISNDEKFLAIRFSENGSDFHKIRFYSTKAGSLLNSPTIENIRISEMSWHFQRNLFLVTQTIKIDCGHSYSLTETCLETLSITQKLILDRKNPIALEAHYSSLGIIINEMDYSRNNKISLFLEDSSHCEIISTEFQSRISFIGEYNKSLYFLSDEGGSTLAPFYWNSNLNGFMQNLIPNKKLNLTDAVCYKNYILLKDTTNIHSSLYSLDLNFSQLTLKEVKYPLNCSTFQFTSFNKNADLLCLTNTSFNFKQRFTFIDKNLNITLNVAKREEESDIIVRQSFVHSKDNVSIPYYSISLQHNQDKNVPTIIRAYGGFGAISAPRYFHENILWIKNGGRIIIANVRGGGEFGKSWHLAGQREKKQNSINDIIAIANKIINEKKATPEKLALYGNSHGGFLVTASALQNPGFFKCIVADRPLLDLYKIKNEQSGWAWIKEFGDAANEEDLLYLKNISPYQLLEKNTAVNIFLISSTTDERVNIKQSIAFLKKFQQISNKNIFLYVDHKTGHGTGRKRSDFIKEKSAYLSFLSHQLGLLWIS